MVPAFYENASLNDLWRFYDSNRFANHLSVFLDHLQTSKAVFHQDIQVLLFDCNDKKIYQDTIWLYWCIQQKEIEVSERRRQAQVLEWSDIVHIDYSKSRQKFSSKAEGKVNWTEF